MMYWAQSSVRITLRRSDSNGRILVSVVITAGLYPRLQWDYTEISKSV